MMALSERAQGILARIESSLPSRRALASLSFAEKLDILDKWKQAVDEYERARPSQSTDEEKR